MALTLTRVDEPPPTAETPRRSVTLPFHPRPWQMPLIADRAPRIVAVVHRRAGKSTGLMWRGFKHALTERKPQPRVVHLLPYNVMWKRTGLWDQVARAADAIPNAVVMRSELVVKFPNGAVYQCGGADNPDAWRGGYADELIADEFDDMPPGLVPLVIEPMLADRAGVLVRSGTPKGKGLLQEAYERARTTPGYSTYLLDYTKTKALPDEAIETLRQEMSEEEFQQELECSFNAPNSGSYYGALMNAAEAEGRITTVDYDPSLAVWTSFDLGIDDATAIWCAQITVSGEFRFVDYIEDSGAALDHYVNLLQERPYHYAMHLLPHDAAVKELGSGRSRTETLQSLGLFPHRVLRAHSVADGINAVRLVLPRAWFDAEKCAKGIKALRNYRREWNPSGETWRVNPRHDWSSHGCLTGDARVLTDEGERRIDQVRVGDRVWTPAGYAAVTAAGPTKLAAELMLITLADGRTLRCTPEHKIATTRGFVRADALRYLDCVLSGNEWQSLLIGSYSKVSSTGFRATITDAINGGKQAQLIFTGRFGKAITGLFRTALRSITETVIPLTMPQRTLSASMSQSIDGFTHWNSMLQARCIPQESWRASGLPNGTEAPRGSNGTRRTEARHGTTDSGSTSLARTAVRNLLRHSRRERNGVISIVRWKRYGADEASQLVYDLTVRNHACYVANGVLVSNSDSMRYMALGTRDTIAPAAPERIKDSWERAFQRLDQEDVRGWRVA